MKRIGSIAAAVAVLCVVPALAMPAQAATPTVAPAAALDTTPPVTSLIVAYEPGVAPADASGEAAGASAVTLTTVSPGEPVGMGLRTVDLPGPVSAREAEAVAAELEQSPDVAWAEPNYVVTVNATETPATWGIDRIDQRALPLDNTYRYGTDGAGVTAYVIDTGIHSTHVDLAGRVSAGQNFAPGVTGTDDCNGHGTHVAGTIGGTTYGVAKAATLVPVRVFDCTGSTTVAAIINGITWVVGDHAAATPAVANMSLEVGAISTALDTAVQSMINDNITVVIASGNSGINSCLSSPGDVPAAITVNASQTNDTFSVWSATQSSNYGSCSDLYAPGTSITSDWFSSNTATNTLNGTSMAAPHVAGAAARLLGASNALTPAQVATSIVSNATTIPGLGRGLLGDPNLLLWADPGVATAPTSPRSVTATPGAGQAVIAWTAPQSDGGSAVTSYTATAYTTSTNGTVVSTPCQPAPLTGLTCTITGLTNGTQVFVDVVAANAIGSSAPSSPRVAVTPAVAATVSSEPRTVAAAPGSTTAVVTWTAPASTGGSAITSYTASAYAGSTGGAALRTCQPSPLTGLTCTITGLTNGTQVWVDVVATNGVGPSPASSPRVAVTPVAAATAPTVPRTVGATAGDASAVVTWTAPLSDGGSAVTSYTATAWSLASGGVSRGTCTPILVTGLTCTITGLTNGTQVFVDVVAVNGVGTSPASTPRVTVTPVAITAPTVPRNVGATAGDYSAVVTWTAPLSDGGSAVTSYTATAWSLASGGVSRGTCQPSPLTGLTCTISGLASGTAVFVDVVATNGIGPSPASSPRVSVTPTAPAGGGGGGGGSTGGGSTGGGGGSSGGAADPGSSAPAPVTVVTTTTAPVAPVSPPAATPPLTVVVVLYIGPPSNGVVRPTAAEAGVVRPVSVPRAAGSTAKAPKVTKKSGAIVRLSVAGLPAASKAKVQIRVGGTWVALGEVTTNAKGRATLPAFKPTKPGTFLVRITTAGGAPQYVKVVVS